MSVDNGRRLRVVTYNIGGWRKDTKALTAAIRGLAPDVLILQEVLRWSDPRTWFIDLAGRLGMAYAFGGFTAFGNAVLTSTAVTVHGRRTVRYPVVADHSPRAAVLVNCSLSAVRFTAVGSHLSTDTAVRQRQAAILRNALSSAASPVVVGVDVNEISDGPAWQTIAHGLLDAAAEAGQADTPTFPTGRPTRRIDAIFAHPSRPVLDYHVVDTPQTRAASDHFPVLAEVLLPLRVAG